MHDEVRNELELVGPIFFMLWKGFSLLFRAERFRQSDQVRASSDLYKDEKSLDTKPIYIDNSARKRDTP